MQRQKKQMQLIRRAMFPAMIVLTSNCLTCIARVVANGTLGNGNTPPHVLFIVGDDVGYADFGFFNGKKTITPTIDALLEEGIFLSNYYTFKICSPSRAAMLTGRYPWAAGFYSMDFDEEHCTTNSTSLPDLLRPLGYEPYLVQLWRI